MPDQDVDEPHFETRRYEEEVNFPIDRREKGDRKEVVQSCLSSFPFLVWIDSSTEQGHKGGDIALVESFDEFGINPNAF